MLLHQIDYYNLSDDYEKEISESTKEINLYIVIIKTYGERCITCSSIKPKQVIELE
jgi:hypothetical protein